jgi:hypothetical protein
VEDAEAQLAKAKKAGATPGEINELAENLFDLQADASRAREELEELSRVPLEQALDRWGNELDQVESLMSIMGDTGELLTRQLGALGGQYQSYLDLMNDSTDPDEIMRHGQDAIDTLLDMYNESVDALSDTLSKSTDAVENDQDDWESAWDERVQAVDDAYQKELNRLDAQAEEVSEKYQEQVDAVHEQQQALRDAWAEADRAKTIDGLKTDRANILAQGYYTEEDARRLEEIRERVAAQEEQARREQQMAALEARAEAKQEDQQEAVEQIEAQRLAAEQAHQVQIAKLEAERKEQMAAFEKRLSDAEAAYAQEVEKLKLKYSDMVGVVIDQEALLLGEESNFYNAGQTLGLAFAAGLEDSIASIGRATAAPVAQMAYPAFSAAGGRNDSLEIRLTSDGNGVTDGHLEAVANQVADIIDQRMANASVSWGRRSH